MIIRIDNKIIKSLKPCTNRYQNYLDHYSDFEGHIEDFLDLDHISHEDKIWVSVRVMPMFLVECFAIDGAVADANAAYAAANANAAANYATNATNATNANAAEKQRQIESIIYLIQNHEEN